LIVIVTIWPASWLAHLQRAVQLDGGVDLDPGHLVGLRDMGLSYLNARSSRSASRRPPTAGRPAALDVLADGI
jgi:hypothetical protein